MLSGFFSDARVTPAATPMKQPTTGASISPFFSGTSPPMIPAHAPDAVPMMKPASNGATTRISALTYPRLIRLHAPMATITPSTSPNSVRSFVPGGSCRSRPTNRLKRSRRLATIATMAT